MCQVSCGDTFKAEPPKLVRTETCSMACAGNTVQYSTVQYSTVQYKVQYSTVLNSMACAGNISAEGNITKTRRGDVDPFEKNRDFDVVLACSREIGTAVNGTL